MKKVRLIILLAVSLAVFLYLPTRVQGKEARAAAIAKANNNAKAEVERIIVYRPEEPRVGQWVTFEAGNFLTMSVDWDFGDGTEIMGGNRTVRHKFKSPGHYTVGAKDTAIAHTPVTTVVTVIPEDRYIEVSPTETRIGETVTVTAHNFREAFVRWDFGDGSRRTAGHSVTHRYNRSGSYTITAMEDCDDCADEFTVRVRVAGLDDTVNMEYAECYFDNEKQYKIVPGNSTDTRAVLKMKLNGTGTIAGYWSVDDHPFDYFSRRVVEGELTEITTGRTPGLPTMEPGLHQVTVHLTKPEDIEVVFPVLKYYVTAREIVLETRSPVERYVAREDEISAFTWKEIKTAAAYRIAFSNTFFPFVSEQFPLTWIDVGADLTYTPKPAQWNRIKRNRWTYWQVRALDSDGNVVAESDVREIKVVIAAAEITIDKVTDLEGKEVTVTNENRIKAKAGSLLVHGSIRYKGDSEFLILRVYVNDTMTDQLLFRDVKKNRERFFETCLPNRKPVASVMFQVLKTSSPSVVVGIKKIALGK